MLLIPCPWCGPRNQIEFTYGGDATLKRPPPDAPAEAWFEFVYLRDNPCGPHDELWLHSAGCRRWFKVRRDTRTHDILASARPDQDAGRRRAVTQSHRLAAGGIVDRSRTLAFSFDGAAYQGHPGDTLASALLANGVHLVGRSFKYHRPRGIVTAGADEPNALVQLARGARTEPNTRATQQELYDGLVAASQNRWPSSALRHRRAQRRVFAVCFRPGFYYKTFMWPPGPRWWLKYEHAIRHAAGLGRAPREPDPDHYEHRYAHCDVLVIGGGPAGLAAARAAARCGARVMLCDENAAFGGSLARRGRPDRRHTGRDVGRRAPRRARGECRDVTLLPRTTAFGYYDQNLVGLVERVADHLPEPPPFTPRQRLWHVRAGIVVLASGALERGIAYADNDLPGTMLAGAAQAYVTRYGVKPGTRAVIFTNNDSAYDSGAELARRRRRRSPRSPMRDRKRRSSATVRDARARRACRCCPAARSSARTAGCESPASTSGSAGRRRDRRIDCDLVCISGGWNPGRASLLAVARQASLRRGACDVRARRLAAGDRRGRRGQRQARPECGPRRRTCRGARRRRALGVCSPPRRSPHRQRRPYRAVRCKRSGRCRRAGAAPSASSTGRTT